MWLRGRETLPEKYFHSQKLILLSNILYLLTIIGSISWWRVIFIFHFEVESFVYLLFCLYTDKQINTESQIHPHYSPILVKLPD